MAPKNPTLEHQFPEDLIVIGRDVKEGPYMDLVDERVLNDLDDNLIRDIYIHNVKQPVLARRTDAGLELVDGRRRVIHSREVNTIRVKEGGKRVKIPVMVVEKMTDEEVLELTISLNMNRKEEDPITLGFKLKRLVEIRASEDDKEGYSKAVRRAAVCANCSEGSVRNYIKICGMHEGVHELIRAGKLGIAAAVALAGMPKDKQLAAAEALILSGAGKDASEARRQRNQSAAGEGGGEGEGGSEGSKPAPKNKPGMRQLKDLIMLYGLERRSGNMNADLLEMITLLEWVVGISDLSEINSEIAGLYGRVLGGEARLEKTNAKKDA